MWCASLVAGPLLGLSVIYAFFAMICHQDPARSWHLMGEPLPVCIRCASIYFGFFASLWLGLSPRTRLLRLAIVVMLAEFLLARLVADTAVARSLSGIFFGATAAPFVRKGMEEITRESM